MIPHVIGWAVTFNGRIQIRTVSDTARSAKVNALVILAGARVSSDWSDERISDAFARIEAQGVKLVRVSCEAFAA